MKKSPYRKLAERIEGNIECSWHCCTDLPKQSAKAFADIFHPSDSEIFEYNHLRISWMSEVFTTIKQDNELRILALLFMDEFVKTDKP